MVAENTQNYKRWEVCYLDSTKWFPGQVEGGVGAEGQHEDQRLVTGGEKLTCGVEPK